MTSPLAQTTQGRSVQGRTENVQSAEKLSQLQKAIQKIDVALKEKGESALTRITRRDRNSTKAELDRAEAQLQQNKSLAPKQLDILAGKISDLEEVLGMSNKPPLNSQTIDLGVFSDKMRAEWQGALNSLPPGVQVEVDFEDAMGLHLLNKYQQNPNYIKEMLGDFVKPENINKMRGQLLQMREDMTKEARNFREATRTPDYSDKPLNTEPEQKLQRNALSPIVKTGTIGMASLNYVGIQIDRTRGRLTLPRHNGSELSTTIENLGYIDVKQGPTISGKAQYTITTRTFPDVKGAFKERVFSVTPGEKSVEVRGKK